MSEKEERGITEKGIRKERKERKDKVWIQDNKEAKRWETTKEAEKESQDWMAGKIQPKSGLANQKD